MKMKKSPRISRCPAITVNNRVSSRARTATITEQIFFPFVVSPSKDISHRENGRCKFGKNLPHRRESVRSWCRGRPTVGRSNSRAAQVANHPCIFTVRTVIPTWRILEDLLPWQINKVPGSTCDGVPSNDTGTGVFSGLLID
jgi:hypothetical protein